VGLESYEHKHTLFVEFIHLEIAQKRLSARSGNSRRPSGMFGISHDFHSPLVGAVGLVPHLDDMNIAIFN
jgi:hypothetical protein